MHLCINILCNNVLEEDEGGLIGSHFYWIPKKEKNIGCKIVYNSEWIMRPNKAFYNIGLYSYHSKIHQMVDSRGD